MTNVLGILDVVKNPWGEVGLELVSPGYNKSYTLIKIKDEQISGYYTLKS